MAAFTKDQKSRIIKRNNIEMEGPQAPESSIEMKQKIQMNQGPEADHE
jgi:hypothetical protein